jgi:2-desacetyl-2-hydroxyethyl bacteriochlorophyllide A dehydrogenase
MKRQSLVFSAPYEIDITEEKLAPPAVGEVLVQTRFSAISHGTEMLMYRGLFPTGVEADDTIPGLRHPLQYPMKYGYAVVGEIIATDNAISRDLIGQTVFCLHPHESCFTADADSVIPVPADIDPRDALFLANMETAVNLLMDGRPVIGEKVAVFGQGVVGLLTTALLAQFPLATLLTLDPYEMRRDASKQAGAHHTLDPGLPKVAEQINAYFATDGSNGLADLAYELSGNPDVLNQAIVVTGFDGRIVVGSWYGSKPAAVDLGSRFHRRRLRLISSQVTTLTPDLAARWSHKRRFEVAWDMIRRLRPAGLITRSMPFSQAFKAYDLIDKDPATTIQVILEYEHG